MDDKEIRAMAYAHKRMEAYPNLEEGSGYIMWQRFKTAFMDGMVVCEKEMTEEMAKLNEEWRENLAIQRAMLIDKACGALDDVYFPSEESREKAKQIVRKAVEESAMTNEEYLNSKIEAYGKSHPNGNKEDLALLAEMRGYDMEE